MAQFSGFFNSAAGDVREYQAADFAKYFSRFLSDGIYVEDNNMGLQVTIAQNGSIVVSPGIAYIRGYIYINDENVVLTPPIADSVLNRKSRVFLTLDETARNIKLELKSGLLASEPVAPLPQNTSNVKQLSLALIDTLRQSTVSIVTDERLTDYCGMVTLLVDAPYEDMFDQWEIWKADTQDAFQAWFDDIRAILDESVVGNLINEIDANSADILANFNELASHLVRIAALESSVNTNTASISLQDGTLTTHESDIANLKTNKMDKTKITLSTLEPNVATMAEGSLWFKYE